MENNSIKKYYAKLFYNESKVLYTFVCDLDTDNKIRDPRINFLKKKKKMNENE